DA
ncbi:hypothetical protein EC80586_0554, partial [Escherichia coli 8.0586]